MEEETKTCTTCSGALHDCGNCKACGTCTCEAGGTETPAVTEEVAPAAPETPAAE